MSESPGPASPISIGSRFTIQGFPRNIGLTEASPDYCSDNSISSPFRIPNTESPGPASPITIGSRFTIQGFPRNIGLTEASPDYCSDNSISSPFKIPTPKRMNIRKSLHFPSSPQTGNYGNALLHSPKFREDIMDLTMVSDGYSSSMEDSSEGMSKSGHISPVHHSFRESLHSFVNEQSVGSSPAKYQNVHSNQINISKDSFYTLELTPAPLGYTSSTDSDGTDSNLSSDTEDKTVTLDPSFGALVLPVIPKSGKD